MSRIYRDYFNQTVITIPDNFIDVKTGESHEVPLKIIEEIDYHSRNNTLQHFILSALTSYFDQPAALTGSSNEVLLELLEIKRMLNSGNRNSLSPPVAQKSQTGSLEQVDLKEIEDLLEAFGG